MLLIKILFEKGLHSDKLVMIDRTRVQQILLNLISNSLKFSKPGDKVTVTIDQSLIKGCPTQINVVVKVSDQGIGISEEDRPFLFTPFFKTRDEHSRRMNLKSNGIGLHYCKSLAKDLGGDLTYNADVTSGAQFCLSLALEKLNYVPKSVKKGSRVNFGKKKFQSLRS